jgi:hypothetical protein
MGDVELKINENLIKPILTAKINEAVIEALGGRDLLIKDIIEHYMRVKVDNEGKVSTYSSDQNRTRMDYLVDQMIKDAMKDAIKTYMDIHKDLLVKELSKFFASKKGSAEILKALSTGVIDSFQSKWTTKIDVKFEPPK